MSRLTTSSMISSSASGKPAARFAFVDGLRGLAALGIVVFHIWWYEPEPYPVLGVEPGVVDALFLKIRGGVQVLLVISGFVIAYTLRKTWVTPAEMLRFVGRRLIRLVPAYWAAIAFVIFVDTICRYWGELNSPFEGHLSISRISAHLTFLQDVTGHDPIGAGMWTICIEMQFYLVSIVGWGIAQQFFRRPVASAAQPSMIGLLLAFAPVALISLFHWRPLDSTDSWVIHFLWMFFLGMITWWTLDRLMSPIIFATFVMIAFGEIAFDLRTRGEESVAYENTVALVTALAIFIAGRSDRLYVWLNWPWLQYLGRISYSLYLIHFPVCHLLTAAGWKWFGNSPTSIQASAILLTSLVASLLAGHVLYVLVEEPSARWAAKTKSIPT